MDKCSDGMMFLTRCSAQSYITSAILGPSADHAFSAGANGQFVKWGKSQPLLPQLIKQRHIYDLVYIPGFSAMGLFALLICKLLGKTCVLKVNRAEDWFKSRHSPGRAVPGSLRQDLLLKVQKESLRFIDAFVTPSFSVIAELISLGIDPQIIHMIPDGVDMEKYHKAAIEEQLATRENLKIPPWMKVVLYSGCFDVLDKNLFTILRVWGEIQRKHDDVFLVLADISQQASAENQTELISFIRDHGLDGCVNYVVGAEASAKYLRIAEMFVTLEGGVAADTILLEAMACELPIIATFNQETDKLIKQGQNGLLVEKGSFQQLFDTIETLILYPGGAKRLGRNARKTIEHTYAAESVAEAYSRLFCSISQG